MSVGYVLLNFILGLKCLGWKTSPRYLWSSLLTLYPGKRAQHVGVSPKATEVLMVGLGVGLLAPGWVMLGLVAVVPRARHLVTLWRAWLLPEGSGTPWGTELLRLGV